MTRTIRVKSLCSIRIGFVFLLISLVLTTATISMGAERQRMQVRNTVVDPGLNVIDPSSPEFLPEVRILLEPDEITKAAQILQYSLVIQNNTGQYLWGFTVVYTYPDRVAPVGRPWRHVIAPSPGGGWDRRFMLPPGSSYLITPVSDFLAACDSTGNKLLRPFLEGETDRITARFLSDLGQGRIEASVDSIILEDGILDGADTAGRLEELNARIRADGDFASAVSGLRGERLRNRLIAYSRATPVDTYARQQAEAARMTLDLLEDEGEAGAMAAVARLQTKWFPGSELVRRKRQ